LNPHPGTFRRCSARSSARIPRTRAQGPSRSTAETLFDHASIARVFHRVDLLIRSRWHLGRDPRDSPGVVRRFTHWCTHPDVTLIDRQYADSLDTYTWPPSSTTHLQRSAGLDVRKAALGKQSGKFLRNQVHAFLIGVQIVGKQTGIVGTEQVSAV